MATNILVCTLGGSWAVVPEVYAFLAHDRLPLYQHHPKQLELARIVDRYQLAAPDQIWIAGTEGEQTGQALEQLLSWHQLLDAPPGLFIWQANGTDQLACPQECNHMQEMLLRICLLAQQRARGGQVVLSLAGGRKTMSADLQWSGQLVGCDALVHVVGEDPLPARLRNPDPADMTRALSASDSRHLFPMVLGRGARSELLDLDFEDQSAVQPERFDLPWPEPNTPVSWPQPQSDWLRDELRRRQQVGDQLLGNYLASLAKSESHGNWRSLYRLPPRIIEHMRAKRIDYDLGDWLRELPKADLHRHLGGCLDIAAQRVVGRIVWDNSSKDERARAAAAVRELLNTHEWPAQWPDMFGAGRQRAVRAAALLVNTDDAILEHNLFEVTAPRVALKQSHPWGFAAYERPGDLSGSALLVHPAAIEPYAEQVVAQARNEGLAYLELRGSPQKYCDGDDHGLQFLTSFHEALRRSLGNETPALLIRFILIVDRRQRDQVHDVVALAVRAKQKLANFVAGLDLAGDEARGQPAELAVTFQPAFEACLPVTIHAGEGEPPESIWQAAYHLHADRIGHGLTVSGHSELAGRFRDRRICLELCPTSNREVVGYYDPNVPASHGCETYPLRHLWDSELPLTICTDNPGISRTTLADEYLAAARMTSDGLSCWEVLAMMKQAFTHAFLPRREKAELLKIVDKRVYDNILKSPP